MKDEFFEKNSMSKYVGVSGIPLENLIDKEVLKKIEEPLSIKFLKEEIDILLKEEFYVEFSANQLKKEKILLYFSMDNNARLQKL